VARGREVFPLYVRSGLVWERAELHWLRRFLKALPGTSGRVHPLKVASLPMGDLYGNHWSTTGEGIPGWRASDSSVYLPGRNVLLMAKGAVHAAMIGAPRLAIGTLKGNPFPDASSGFFRALARALAAGLDFPLRIEAPFLELRKEDLIRRFGDLPLELSFSCSSPRGLDACLRCAKCRERILAFSSRPPRRATARRRGSR
jgi:7-cyano-7-deazaguanine synthase